MDHPQGALPYQKKSGDKLHLQFFQAHFLSWRACTHQQNKADYAASERTVGSKEWTMRQHMTFGIPH